MTYGFTQNTFIMINRIADNLGRIATALEKKPEETSHLIDAIIILAEAVTAQNEEVASRYTTLSTLETFNYDTPATPGGREES